MVWLLFLHTIKTYSTKCLYRYLPTPTTLLLLLFTFLHDIYKHVPETNHVSTVSNVAAILQLQIMVHSMLHPMSNVLCFYISGFRRMYAVSNMAVFCSFIIIIIIINNNTRTNCNSVVTRWQYSLHQYRQNKSE